jgi:hypothetical protein
MGNFAIIEDRKVTNIIVADSKAIAEEVTGKTCVEFTNEYVAIDTSYEDGVFIQPKPFLSWVLNSAKQWEAPISKPSYDKENPVTYVWDESVTNWVPFIEKQPPAPEEE